MLMRELFDEFPFNGCAVVPLELQQLLNQPLNVCDDWQRAERLLLEAGAKMPEWLEIKVALYKMYAYSNRLDESLALIDEVLREAALQGGFCDDWRKLEKDSAEWGNARGAVRFYLYSLKALGFVLLRKGEVMMAYEALQKLCELDPGDQVGGGVVYEMAERIQDDVA